MNCSLVKNQVNRVARGVLRGRLTWTHDLRDINEILDEQENINKVDGTNSSSTSTMDSVSTPRCGPLRPPPRPSIVCNEETDIFWPFVYGFIERALIDSDFHQWVRMLFGAARARWGYGWGKPELSSDADQHSNCSASNHRRGHGNGQKSMSKACGCRCPKCISFHLFDNDAAKLWDDPGADGRPIGIIHEGSDYS